MAGLKLLMGSQPSPLYTCNLVSSGKTNEKKPAHICSKRPHAITNINANINVDSGKTGSKNVHS